MFIKNFRFFFRKETLRIAITGGSNSVIRKGYGKYLYSYLNQATFRPTSLKYYSLGGVPNVFGVIQQDRYDIASNSDIIFFEYCVNDRYAIEINKYSLELAGQSLEGFIRKCHKSNPDCLIVILIFGINLNSFYHQHCALSELYESIGKHYSLPVINLTKLLGEQKGLDFIKTLYSDKDHAHYTRPNGVEIVSKTILEQLNQTGVIDTFKLRKNLPKARDVKPIYADNFEKLTFIENFEHGNFFSDNPKISIYQNTVFREKNFTIYPGNCLKFLLKGKLIAIFIKSDLNDGFINIDFNSQRIVTSSYSSWVNKIKPQNVINLIALPLLRFSASQDFAPVSISLCHEYPDHFELDLYKSEPVKKNPQRWKLSIIGIAYIGEVNYLQ